MNGMGLYASLFQIADDTAAQGEPHSAVGSIHSKGPAEGAGHPRREPRVGPSPRVREAIYELRGFRVSTIAAADTVERPGRWMAQGTTPPGGGWSVSNCAMPANIRSSRRDAGTDSPVAPVYDPTCVESDDRAGVGRRRQPR